ncbi:hypothetical protein NEPAR06_0012 [Nematocida parisii]|uniref:uncharacterized protein n=1 Tax=Nematocida parisii (strain ERTm1 / ATCC PRA-289) TaxID=881290 RepID=UPI000264B537|nr:uncharacterized protein NEPG_00102 [Nematocida parisii ERTm1]EIJ94581.1 hypothetical protein NEPG_00102 [Nematocida parisii ERTm1]KAI5142707.1 hypothetical protein NEPAR07_0233 [Nematocida parisii]KAI5152891.1 hypothetical protein NEPAR06_0012 [Nematocida parisii]KAI5157283.1 hypothetical protein NEPAR05_1148 [Nematocida parisii]|eukprot:XP_013057936.1 hypothetical protein NEPG_00102 [Nematocida parisii ERTm1]
MYIFRIKLRENEKRRDFHGKRKQKIIYIDVFTRSNATAALLRNQEREESEREALFIVFRKRPKSARARSPRAQLC